MAPTGGARLLVSQDSADVADRIALTEMIHSGFRIAVVEEALAAVGLTLEDLGALGAVAERTLGHSRRSGRFNPTQSDRLARFLRVFQKTRQTFASDDKARAWLTRPTSALNGSAPVHLIDTEANACVVEGFLVRIDHGLAT